MAELVEVMQQARRMCDSYGICDDCQIAGSCVLHSLASDGNYTDEILEKFEQTVMQWAAEHPEPKYPTWREWQQEHFRDGANMIRPCEFMSRADAHCFDYMDTYGCRDCANQPIPADIAEKLGVKPKEADHEKC